MMTPRSPSASGASPIMWAAARRIRLKLPIRLISITWRKASSAIGPSRPTMRAAGPMPAQLIRMRAAPCAARALPTAAADLGALRARRRVVDVEERDLGAGDGERPRGRRAEPGTAAGDDGGMTL